MLYQNTNYLEHHGIKGQKWGVRRYQNEDGTLTAEGKKRYKYSTDNAMKRAKKFANKSHKSGYLKKVAYANAISGGVLAGVTALATGAFGALPITALTTGTISLGYAAVQNAISNNRLGIADAIVTTYRKESQE